MTDKNIYKISLLTAFLEGCFVLAVELMGAKIISSYYGTSFYVWTSVLGITLLSLTAGYFMGGKASYGGNLNRVLWSLFLLSAVIVFFIPVLAPKILMFFLSFGIKWGSVFSSLVIIGPALFCFGGITPLLIQMNAENVKYAGKISGTIYAFSTVGGIITCLLLGFVVIPNWGISSPLIFVVIIILILLALLSKNKTQLMSAIVLVMIVSFILSSNILFKSSISNKVIVYYLSEGILGQLRVKDVMEPGGRFPIRVLTINEIPQTKNINSIGGLGVSVWRYPHIISMISSLKKAPGAKALICGFGGGTIANEISRLGFSVDVVDIDKRMFEIGMKYYNYNPSKTNFILDDARHYINTVDKKYDLIIIDLLNGEVQPSHLFSKQSFDKLKKMMSPDAIFILNYQGPADIKRGIAFESINNTLRASGYHTYYWSLMEDITADILFYSSIKPIDFSGLKIENLNECCTNTSNLTNFLSKPYIGYNTVFKKGMILDDDRPMLENLNSEAILVWRKRMIEEANAEIKEGMRLFK